MSSQCYNPQILSSCRRYFFILHVRKHEIPPCPLSDACHSGLAIACTQWPLAQDKRTFLLRIRPGKRVECYSFIALRTCKFRYTRGNKELQKWTFATPLISEIHTMFRSIVCLVVVAFLTTIHGLNFTGSAVVRSNGSSVRLQRSESTNHCYFTAGLTYVNDEPRSRVDCFFNEV